MRFSTIFAAEPVNSLAIVRNRTTSSSFSSSPPTFGDEHRYNDDIFATSRLPAVKPFVYRALQLRGWALLGLLILILAVLVVMIWRNLERFETIRTHVHYAHRIMQTGLDLQKALNDSLHSEPKSFVPDRLDALANDLKQLRLLDRHLDPDTPHKLQMVEAELADPLSAAREAESRRSRLLLALNIMSQMLDAETARREELLGEISRDTRAEVTLASLTLAAILLVTGLFLKRRILAPLHDLRELLSRIAQEDFSPIATRHLDPVLVPVFTSYNEMVRQLAELQEAKRRYAESLEGEVRSATRALLEQQLSLARAERLAALGELAAGIAHELRNPLAGIQMSCSNLRREIVDIEQAQRLDLIIAELKRMTCLLNGLLAHGRHSPTPATDCDLVSILRELLAITRYQIPPHINLRQQGPDRLPCHLPESELRQALLNLILNAADAIGAAPGEIQIQLHERTKEIEIEVCDNGPGFPDDMLRYGIRPFGTNRQGGTGLGLAIVQRFVRELGGQLLLSNREPRGACVRLLIPRDFIAARQEQAP
jgi:signal transduction histidine kinase